eukprot:SAG31_NODE_13020_length_899_cov_1.071250_1_plen_125_part_10
MDSPGWTDADGHSCAYLATNGGCSSREVQGPCCASCNAPCVDDDATAQQMLGYECIPAGYRVCEGLQRQNQCDLLIEQGQQHVCGCSCAPDYDAGYDMSQFDGYTREFDPSVGCSDGSECCDLPW